VLFAIATSLTALLIPLIALFVILIYLAPRLKQLLFIIMHFALVFLNIVYRDLYSPTVRHILNFESNLKLYLLLRLVSLLYFPLKKGLLRPVCGYFKPKIPTN
jgi:hypothetical protein